jgi:hypothetical protein
MGPVFRVVNRTQSHACKGIASRLLVVIASHWRTRIGQVLQRLRSPLTAFAEGFPTIPRWR